MSTLFRARPKSREDLPEWTKCCERHIQATLAIPEIVVDLSRRIAAVSYCRWCDSEMPKAVGVMDVADAKYVYLDELEIDEKPVEAE